MVSVDRNTLISQIVSLNPQLKPDELHELSDAQLQAKLSQCIAGNKQDKNVDSVRINNSSSETSKTPKMTTEEAQNNAIENIESNAEQAQKLLDAQDDGDISKAYNFVKEKLNSELAKSNVAKVVHKQFETAEFLREAKQGTLTYKEYLRRKREDIFKTFPEIDNYNDKQKQMIKKGLDSLTEGQLNRLQNQLLALPKKDDKNYQNSVNSFKQNFFEESTVEKTTTARIGEVSKTSKSREIKKAYNPSDGDRLMTFEETYLLEQGVEFNKENIQKFNDSTAQYTFANSLTNKRNEIHSLLTSALEKAKVQGSTGLSSVDLINAELIPSIGASITKLYGKDNLAKGLKDLTNGQYSLNDEIKSLEDLSRKDVSAMNNIAKLILTKIDENYSKALNGKKLEDYAKTMANDYKNAFGTKDASALASSFAQDQEGIVQTARNTVQIAGMVVMVGGMAFCPPAALGGGLISSFGGIGVEAYNENTKENPDKEKNKELGQEALVNAALLLIGAGSGKVGSMAKTALTAKNAPKLVAAMADIGVDSSLSLLGDLTLTGQIDLSGEGFSQLMSLVAGHKGKIVKGVQKGKQFLKEKFNAQANSNNKILQMPDGTLVEVKPDGSTVVKDTPRGMLDVEKQELITKASRENPANRVEEKVREEWQKTDIETSAPDEKVDLFNLDRDAGLRTSAPEIKNETTSLILNGKLNENLTKRYDEMSKVFTEIAQRRSADIQKLADQYPNDKQKVADGICKILSEEFGMQGYEPPIVLKDTQGADGGADWPNGRIIINKEITNLKQLTTMISHEYVHMLQFRDIVVQYGEQGVKDLINNDKSIPQDKKEQAINAALNNPYNKHLIASYNAQKAQTGSVDYYVRRIYKDEFTNTIGTDDMEGYTNQVAEREAYYGGSEHIGNNTTSLDQTNIGMAPADGAMAALRARMKAQLIKGKQTHNDVEVKTKKQEPSTQFEIDGDGQIHFKETPAGKLNNLTDFNLPIDETLLNNILNKKFPLAGGNESKLKDSYKKRYAPNHNGIFEEEILDNDTIKFIVKDKTTGKIIRECTYNRVNKQNNVDTFYQYSKDNQETLGYNIDANGNIQSIIIHSKDNEDLKCSINEDSTVEINSKTNSYTITVEEFKQHFGFSPILESKLNKNINLQTNKNIQQSSFNFSKYIDSNNIISYIVDSPNRTQISRKWLIDEQKNTITILNPETEDVIQNISDAKTYIKLLSEIETFAPKNHIQLYLIESMPIEKLKFIKDCLIKGQTNKDLANITTKWKDHWSDFQVGTTTATPNRKLRKEFDKLLQNNIILEDDINITRYDTFDFLKTISIKNKNGNASSLGEEIELLINKQASQEEIDNFLFEMNAPITNKNFMACNLNTTTQSYSGNNNRKCIYNITLKSGTQCVYIDDMVNPNEMMKPYQYQSELVINKEQNYEITGMHLNDDKNKMIIDLLIWSE